MPNYVFLRYVNFGGHPWTKPFLLKVAKFMVPLPSLTNLILPIDGLARCDNLVLPCVTNC